jgi:hypothetical protein
MPALLSLGLVMLGPFVSIAFLSRDGDFRAARLIAGAVVGELLGIAVYLGLNALWTRLFLDKVNRVVVFFPPSSRSDQLVGLVTTLLFVIGYAVAVAATVLIGHWVYVRVRQSY